MLTTPHSKSLGEWGKCHKHGKSCRAKLLLPIPRAARWVRNVTAICSEFCSYLQHDRIWTNSCLRTVWKNLICETQELDEIQQSSFWEDSLKPRKLWSSLKVWVRQQNSQWDNDKVLTWDVSDPGSSSSSAAFREGFEPLLLHLGWAS